MIGSIYLVLEGWDTIWTVPQTGQCHKKVTSFGDATIASIVSVLLVGGARFHLMRRLCLRLAIMRLKSSFAASAQTLEPVQTDIHHFIAHRAAHFALHEFFDAAAWHLLGAYCSPGAHSEYELHSPVSLPCGALVWGAGEGTSVLAHHPQAVAASGHAGTRHPLRAEFTPE